MSVYDFDQVIDRRHSGSLKWDDAAVLFDTKDVLPLWVADMDFPAPPPVLEAIRQRTAHGVFGYPSPRFLAFDALSDWLGNRHPLDDQHTRRGHRHFRRRTDFDPAR